MKKMTMTLICASLPGLCSCKKELVEYRQGDLRVSIEQGSEWLHDFPLMLGIKKKNAPQIAIWIEDTQGRYLGTVYASHKIATQSWTAAGGNRRKEALPYWCHARGVRYDDGLYLPTRNHPLTDAVTGATPRASFDMRLTPESSLQKFVLKVEVTHLVRLQRFLHRISRRGHAHLLGRQNGQRTTGRGLCRRGRSHLGRT